MTEERKAKLASAIGTALAFAWYAIVIIGITPVLGWMLGG